MSGLTRKAAAEYSFLLAVPTLTAATAYKSLKIFKTIEPSQVTLLLLGNAIAFAVALVTIRLFIGYLTRRGFFAFGVYRIILGGILLWLMFNGRGAEI